MLIYFRWDAQNVRVRHRRKASGFMCFEHNDRVFPATVVFFTHSGLLLSAIAQ